MGVILGPGFDLRSRATRDAIASALTEGRDGSMHASMRGVIDDDVLFDHPDKTHAARLVIWVAWELLGEEDMDWFAPFLAWAKVEEWSPADSYGSAARYGARLAEKE